MSESSGGAEERPIGDGGHDGAASAFLSRIVVGSCVGSMR